MDDRFDGTGWWDEPADENKRWQPPALTAKDQEMQAEHRKYRAEARAEQKRDAPAIAAERRADRGGLPDSSPQNPADAGAYTPFKNLRSR